MNEPGRIHRSPIVGFGAVVSLMLLAACSDPMGPDSSPGSLQDSQESEAIATQDAQLHGDGEIVTVCKVVTSGDPGPYDFTVSQEGGRAGNLLQGSTFSLADGECVVVWQAADDPPSEDPPATVTVAEVDLPAGMQFDSAIVESPFAEVPRKSLDPEAWSFANYFHGALITFYNSEPPPPPPACVGLTPGYWKNWSNHYTAEQFESLLAGTIASSIEEAAAILSPRNKKDPVAKLAKFVLANQLTLNLTGTDLPNPDGAGLTGDCTHAEFDGELGPALEQALAILDDPGAYDDDEIEDLKDFLDAIANSGEEEEED